MFFLEKSENISFTKGGINIFLISPLTHMMRSMENICIDTPSYIELWTYTVVGK